MFNLEQVVEQIKSEITINEKGVAIATIGATARIVGISQPALSQSFSPHKQGASSLSVFLTSKGFDAHKQVTFKNAGIPDIAVSAIATYYAMYAGHRCTELAKLVCEVFQAIGVRAWMQDVVGWKSGNDASPANISTTPSTISLATLDGVAMVGDALGKLAQGIKAGFEMVGDDIKSSAVSIKVDVAQSRIETAHEIRRVGDAVEGKVDALQTELQDIRSLLQPVEQVNKPARTKAQDRSITFHLLTDEEYETLVALADRSPMSRSQFFREIILKAVGEEL